MRHWRAGDDVGVAGLSVTEGARPEPTATEMVVEVHAAALNFSDLLMIDGTYQIKPPRPFTPGQEVAGMVVSTPEGSHWAPGDRIAAKVLWGGFGEFARVRTDMAIRIPDGVDLARAAALPVVYTTAMVALSECASVSADDRVLVHAAAGGVGLAAVEIAKARGAQVIATAGSEAKLALAKAHGADAGINYRSEDWVAAVKALTEDHGADLILDPVGGEIGERSLRCIARDGTLLIVGFASGDIPKLAGHQLLLKRAAAKGVYWDHDFDGPMIKRATDELIRMLVGGEIDPVVDDGYGFDDLPRALADLGTRGSVGKLIIRMHT